MHKEGTFSSKAVTKLKRNGRGPVSLEGSLNLTSTSGLKLIFSKFSILFMYVYLVSSEIHKWLKAYLSSIKSISSKACLVSEGLSLEARPAAQPYVQVLSNIIIPTVF